MLFTFETVSAAPDCEQIFQGLDIPCRVIPAPRVFSSSCMYAISTETGDPDGLGELLRQRGAGYAGMFQIEEGKHG
jgi:hypothetical protein